MVRFKLPDQLQPVDLRHTDIGYNNVKVERGERIKQMFAVRINTGDNEGAALFADHSCQTFANQNFIIYNRNTQQAESPFLE